MISTKDTPSLYLKSISSLSTSDNKTDNKHPESVLLLVLFKRVNMYIYKIK